MMWSLFVPRFSDTAKPVSISDPAGEWLACAHELVFMGYKPKIYQPNRFNWAKDERGYLNSFTFGFCILKGGPNV